MKQPINIMDNEVDLTCVGIRWIAYIKYLDYETYENGSVRDSSPR